MTFGVVFALLIGSVSLLSFGFIGSEAAPMGDQGQFVVYVELPRDATIEQTNDAACRAEEIIRSSPLVETLIYHRGRGRKRTTAGTSGGDVVRKMDACLSVEGQNPEITVIPDREKFPQKRPITASYTKIER
jgi:multidrug efflux pump subunit AcrB